jgi:hypothetical protein
MTLSSLKKLDEVLSAMYRNDNRDKEYRKFSINNIYSLIQDYDIEIKYEELYLLIDKLLVDKYIYKTDSIETGGSEDLYYLNLTGKVFIEQGGYVRKNKIDNSSIRTLTVLSWLIAIASGIAAVYYIISIYFLIKSNH